MKLMEGESGMRQLGSHFPGGGGDSLLWLSFGAALFFFCGDPSADDDDAPAPAAEATDFLRRLSGLSAHASFSLMVFLEEVEEGASTSGGGGGPMWVSETIIQHGKLIQSLKDIIYPKYFLHFHVLVKGFCSIHEHIVC